jgi:hypothetical protein
VDYRGSKRTAPGDRVFGVRWAERHGILIDVVCDMDSARQHDISPSVRQASHSSGDPMLHQSTLFGLVAQSMMVLCHTK